MNISKCADIIVFIADFDKTTMERIIKTIPVLKSLEVELRQVTYVAMMPDFTDGQGDFTSVEEVRKAKESFNSSEMRSNLFHMQMTDSFTVIESYVAPCDMQFQTVTIQKGTWLVTLQVHDDDVWEAIKNEEITGVSIGALAVAEEIE